MATKLKILMSQSLWQTKSKLQWQVCGFLAKADLKKVFLGDSNKDQQPKPQKKTEILVLPGDTSLEPVIVKNLKICLTSMPPFTVSEI